MCNSKEALKFRSELREQAIVNGVKKYNCVIFEEDSDIVENNYSMVDRYGNVRNFRWI